MTRALVVTADDLGYDPVTNREIASLLADGLITAASLIAVSPHAADAMDRLAEVRLPEGFSPAVHVTLSSERGREPWRPLAADVGTLTDDDGTFFTDPAAMEAKGDGEQVAGEAAAQLGWLHRHGARPYRMDSHSGTVYGLRGRSYLRQMLALCADHGLDFRLPRSLRLVGGQKLPSGLQELHSLAVRAADALGVALPEELVTNPHPAAEIDGYPALREYYLRAVAGLPEGTSELMLHPSAASPWTAHSEDWAKRVWELQLLRDPVFTAALDVEHIERVARW